MSAITILAVVLLIVTVLGLSAVLLIALHAGENPRTDDPLFSDQPTQTKEHLFRFHQ